METLGSASIICSDNIGTLTQNRMTLGILEDGGRAITGAESDTLTDSDLNAQVKCISVYARVSPENKIRIVKAWQQYPTGLFLILVPLPVVELSKDSGLIKHHS